MGIYWDMTKQTEHGEYEKCWLTDALATEEVPDDMLPSKALNTRDVVSLVLLFLRQRGRDGYDAAYRVCYVSQAGLLRTWKRVDKVQKGSMWIYIAIYNLPCTFSQGWDSDCAH